MIELRGVTVRYPGRPAVTALEGLTLGLQPGVTLLQGPVGAGKTTLVRALAGLRRPDGGSIHYPWNPATLAQVRSRVGYVPQENRLTPPLSCEAALRYLAATRGLPAGRADVAALLARWGLALARHKRLDRLSSGEARRWLLAQSQLVSPDLWLLDEPLHGLDAWGLRTLRAELARYAAPGAGRYAVVVSQDPRLDDLPARRVRLAGGRLAAA